MRCKAALHHPMPLVRSLKNELWCQMPNYKWYVKKGYLVKLQETTHMEELEELQKLYEEKIEEIQEQVDDWKPTALLYMEKYINSEKQLTEYKDKLESLLEKLGKSQEEEDEDGE